MAEHGRKHFNFLGVTKEELVELVRPESNPEGLTRTILFLVGVVFTPIVLIGVLFGYKRAYYRFLAHEKILPRLVNMQPIVKVAMVLGGIGIVVLLIVIYNVAGYLFGLLMGSDPRSYLFGLIYLVVASLVTFFVMARFGKWRSRHFEMRFEEGKYGTARWATNSELDRYEGEEGIYIGSGMLRFNDKGHLITVAGTRGGKGTNLIIPNLLGLNKYQGSWVVIDPKGENAAITVMQQRKMGRNVVVLNPWNLLQQQIGPAQCYNPLDLIAETRDINFVDDVSVLAEMIVPTGSGKEDKFFSDNARSIIGGLIMHLMTYDVQEEEKMQHPNAERKLVAPKEEQNEQRDRTKDDIVFFPPKTLSTIWQWLRLPDEQWDLLMAEMRSNSNPYNGLVIRTAADEIMKLKKAGDRTFGSILGVALQSTAFLNSPSLQNGLYSEFDPYTLVDGKTTLYIIIPVDKLQSHSRWLRLVTTSMLRAVVRKPDNKVTFILDEFAALGYIREIENALSTYAGYEVTLWVILQSLIQLQHIYGQGWETFLGNSAIRHFFNINDNFTANYVSHMIGITTDVREKPVKNNEGHVVDYRYESNQRQLITPAELQRASGDYIFALFNNDPPTYFRKAPYYLIEELQGKYSDNPYIKIKRPSKKIICLFGDANTQKVNVVKETCDLLVGLYEKEAKLSASPIDYNKDILVSVEINGCKIGFDSKGNSRTWQGYDYLKKLIDNSYNDILKDCKVIVCALNVKELPSERMEDFAKQHDFEIDWTDLKHKPKDIEGENNSMAVGIVESIINITQSK